MAIRTHHHSIALNVSHQDEEASAEATGLANWGIVWTQPEFVNITHS
jgi:hypothetical protein